MGERLSSIFTILIIRPGVINHKTLFQLEHEENYFQVKKPALVFPQVDTCPAWEQPNQEKFLTASRFFFQKRHLFFWPMLIRRNLLGWMDTFASILISNCWNTQKISETSSTEFDKKKHSCLYNSLSLIASETNIIAEKAFIETISNF